MVGIYSHTPSETILGEILVLDMFPQIPETEGEIENLY